MYKPILYYLLFIQDTSPQPASPEPLQTDPVPEGPTGGPVGSSLPLTPSSTGSDPMPPPGPGTTTVLKVAENSVIPINVDTSALQVILFQKDPFFSQFNQKKTNNSITHFVVVFSIL